MTDDNYTDLLSLVHGQPELDKLLDRIAVLLPITREQEHLSSEAAIKQYFDSGRGTAEARKAWEQRGIMSAADLQQVHLPEPQTPEVIELKSICLAVAAFGGADVIEHIGWILKQRGHRGEWFWSECDGMADFDR